MICDICDLRLGDWGDHGFVIDRRGQSDETSFDEDFEPISALIRFFNCETQLRDEFLIRTGPTHRPVVRPDAGAPARTS